MKARTFVSLMMSLLVVAASCTSSTSGSDGNGAGGKPSGSSAGNGGGSGSDGGANGEGGSDADAGPKITASGKWVGATGTADDPADDAEVTGDVPDFVEIVGASVEGSPEELSLKLEMSGDIPESMPDETTYMIISWNLAGSKKFDTVGISAQAGIEGWTVSAAIDNELADWTGDFAIDGNVAVVSMPWNFVNKPHAFDWSTSASFYATAADPPSSSGDNITDGHFPSK